MRPGFKAGGLAFAVALVTAVAASAATIETKRFPGTPALAGDSVLWTQYTSNGLVELWSGAPGSAPSRIQRVASPGQPGYLTAGLAASPALALLTTTRYGPGTTIGNLEPTSFAYRVGPPTGPLEVVAECHRGGVQLAIAAADAWHEAYAYRQCDEGGGHVEVRDTDAEPLSPPRSVGLGGAGVRIAGRYVAWLDGPYGDVPGSVYDIVVYDRVADAELYRVPRSELDGSPRSLDLQEDGKLAFVFGSGRADRRVEVAWSSPDDPHVHLTPLPAREQYTVRIADDRVAYQGGERTLYNAIEDAEVGIVDLAGTTERIALGTKALSSADSFDYDGESFLWRELGCQHWRLVRRSDARPNLSSAAKLCDLRFSRSPGVRGKKAVFGLRCAPLPRPCRFDVFLHLGKENERRAGTALSRRNPVRIKLARRARLRLEERGRVRVTATVIAYGGALPFDTFQQVRRRTIRLSSAR